MASPDRRARRVGITRSGALLPLTLVISCAQPRAHVTRDAPAATVGAPIVPAVQGTGAVYDWLLAAQAGTPTGLLATVEGNRYAQLYNNALAAIAFVRFGNPDAAAAILHFYQERLGVEFYGPHGEPRGFYQQRDAATGEPMKSSDRWMGDNGWLLIATHYYEAEHPGGAFRSLADALRGLFGHLRTPDGAYSYCASGWHGDGSPILDSGHTEGNLDAHAALAVDPATAPQAREVQGWLDFRRHNWRLGPLDIHNWRVLSLGPEYGYCLNDNDRTDRPDLRFAEVVDVQGQPVRGFINCSLATCPVRHDTIFAEATGSEVAAYYAAGFRREGDAYLGAMDHLLVPAHAGAAVPVLARDTRDKSYSWARPDAGSVAPAAWYLFDKAKFNPYTLRSMAEATIADPVAHIEAEDYDAKRDPAGCLANVSVPDVAYGGEALRVDSASCTAMTEYSFNLLARVEQPSVSVRTSRSTSATVLRVAFDDAPAIACAASNAGVDYVWTEPAAIPALAAGLHTMRVEFAAPAAGPAIDAFRIHGAARE
jgi:hypothetical protein